MSLALPSAALLRSGPTGLRRVASRCQVGCHQSLHHSQALPVME